MKKNDKLEINVDLATLFEGILGVAQNLVAIPLFLGSIPILSKIPEGYNIEAILGAFGVIVATRGAFNLKLKPKDKLVYYVCQIINEFNQDENLNLNLTDEEKEDLADEINQNKTIQFNDLIGLSVRKVLNRTPIEAEQIEKKIIKIVDFFISKLCEQQELFNYFAFNNLIEVQKEVKSVLDIVESIKETIQEPFSRYVIKQISINTQHRNKQKNNTYIYNRLNKAKFVGREDEINELDLFLDNDNAFLWWAVTGEGGTGKTRLIDEYIIIPKEKWTKVIFSQEFFEQISNFNKTNNYNRFSYPENLLIVIKDVEKHVDILKSWLLKLDEDYVSGSNKIRILLDVREEIVTLTKTGTTTNINNSHFYNNLFSFNSSGICIKDIYSGNSLKIKPLKSNDVDELIVSYFESKKKNITRNEMVLIKEKVRYIDNDLTRVLYILFVCELYNQNSDISLLGKDAILHKILELEYEHMNKIFNYHGTQHSAFECLKRLLLYATINNGLDLNKLPLFLSSDYTYLKSFVTDKLEKDFNGFLTDLGLYNKDVYHNLLLPLKPDILGEYFFEAEHLILKTNCKNELQNINDNLLTMLNYDDFIERFCRDFPESKLIDENYLFMIPSYDKIDAFCDVLDKASNSLNYELKIQKLSEIMETVLKQFEKPNFWTIYCKILFGLAYVKGEIEHKLEVINKICDVANKKDIYAVWLVYAKALYNLTKVQIESNELKHTCDLIYNIAQNKDIDDIWVYYAIALYNLTVVQTEPNERKHTCDLIYNIAQNKDIDAIWVVYSTALVNLTVVQTESNERKHTCDLIYNIAQNKDIDAIWVLYSKALFKLTVVQTESNERKHTCDLIYNIVQKKDIDDIWVTYAKALVNLTVVQTEENERKHTRDLIYNIAQKKDIDDIWVEYAKALVNLTVAQTEENERKHTCDLIYNIAQKKDIDDIWVQYAKALVNLTVAQTEENERKHTCDLIYNIAQKKDIDDIWVQYSSVLVNLAVVQTEENEIKHTCDLIYNIAQKKNIDDIWVAYAKALFNIIVAQTEENERKHTRNLIYNIAQNKDIDDIWVTYAKALVNLTVVQTEENERKHTCDLIYNIAQKKDIDDIWVQYSSVLVNLAVVQTEENEIKHTCDLIYNIAQKKNIDDIWVAYAKALFNITVAQTEENERKHTRNLIYNIAQNKDIDDIWVTYAKALVNLTVVQTEENERKHTFNLIYNIAQSKDIDDVWIMCVRSIVKISLQGNESKEQIFDYIKKVEDILLNKKLPQIYAGLGVLEHLLLRYDDLTAYETDSLVVRSLATDVIINNYIKNNPEHVNDEMINFYLKFK